MKRKEYIPTSKPILSYEEKIGKVDFGDIDGLYDINLTKYYLDEDYWKKLGESRKCFIIGRKGTGKSALYQWLNNQGQINGAYVSNLSFGDFPLAKLLGLRDADFSRPNQYQTIIRNILLCEFAKQITTIPNIPQDDNWHALASYVNFIFGDDLTDLHKQVVTVTHKTDAGITQPVRLGVETGQTISYGEGESNLFKINRMLSERLSAYLKAHTTPRIIIQIDQLDDGYNSYRDKEAYRELILSLFKAVYEINQQFHVQGIPAKVIVYIRADIYHGLNQIDAESARWDGLLHTINWSIVNKSDWHNPKLLQLLNRRVIASLPNETFKTIFPELRTDMDDQGINVHLFKFMIHRSFHRPRDVIQFCTKIKEAVCDDGRHLKREAIAIAEKKYALWFLSEIENEIAAEIKNTQDLYELLRGFGGGVFSMQDFINKYYRYAESLGLEPEKLLRMLYNYGIIHNISMARSGGIHEMFSIVRNEKSVFNRDLMIQIHVGYQRSLYISKFSGRGLN